MLPTGDAVSSAASLSLVGSGSNWSLALTAALLVVVPGAVTVALIVSVPVAPTGSAPTDHTPDVGSQPPWVALAATSATPAGSRSVTATPVASSGPRLSTVTV